MVHQLAIGDCIDFPVGSVVVAVSRLDCGQPHDAEYFGFVNLTGLGEPYPGVEIVGDEIIESCLARFEDYVGIDYESSSLEIAFIYPEEDGWSIGNRRGECFLVTVDGSKLIGSVEDTAV